MPEQDDKKPQGGEQGRHSDERFVQHEEELAALEAAGIGGDRPDYEGDEAERAVEEGGGGEAEGFEEAERELIEAASHGENRHDPTTEAFTPEEESDRSTAVYGEPDEEDVTEVVEDPREGPDDPGAGPGVAADR
jgi:hypothetical protein